MRVRLIGYWSGVWSTDGPWPDPRDFIDSTWSDQQRDLVASYLEQGLRVRASPGFSRCRICSKTNGWAEATDRVFLWPTGLAHYVRDHSVRLPDEVILHIYQQPPDGVTVVELSETERSVAELVAAGKSNREIAAELFINRRTVEDLNETERSIAERLAAGKSNRQIADEYFMSLRTVRANIFRVYRKLGVPAKPPSDVDREWWRNQRRE